MSWETICDPKALTSVGLGLDIVGIMVLFKFQIDFNKDLHAGPTQFALSVGEEANPERERTYIRYVRWTRTGQVLIALGFSLQLLGVWA